jgi:putative DNA topoisomerase
MKQILISLIAIFVITSVFAQKRTDIPVPSKEATLKTTYACPMHPEVTSDKPGKCTKCNMQLQLTTKEQMKTAVTDSYVCPMHSEVKSDHAGKCPKCQSQLVASRTGSKQGAQTYTCSMHPNVVSDKSGKCPVCGMALKEVKKPQDK